MAQALPRLANTVNNRSALPSRLCVYAASACSTSLVEASSVVLLSAAFFGDVFASAAGINEHSARAHIVKNHRLRAELKPTHGVKPTRGAGSMRKKDNDKFFTMSIAYNRKMDKTLFWIVCACVTIGAVSVVIAATAAFRLKPIALERMVSFSIGLMLATSLIHTIPEALETKTNVTHLFYVLLGSILLFFLLQKFALLRHNHHHEHDGHAHAQGHDAHIAGSGGWMIVLGGSFHNFTDGLVIAAAFLTDKHLGLLTALAIAAHEIPHKLGDFVVLLSAGFNRKRALLMDLLSSATVIAGGVFGWWLLGETQAAVPYMLMVAAGSFIYIAMSDLIPYVQHESRVRDVVPQVVLMALGVLIVLLLNEFRHAH